MRAMFVKYNQMPTIEPVKGVSYRPLVVDNLCSAIVDFKKGATEPSHKHADEQISFCLKGKIEFIVQDDTGERKEIVTAGMAYGFEPWVAHGLVVLEDSTTVEVWSRSERHLANAKKLGLVVNQSK